MSKNISFNGFVTQLYSKPQSPLPMDMTQNTSNSWSVLYLQTHFNTILFTY